MDKGKFYQEGPASWLPNDRQANPGLFFLGSLPLHQAVKPTSSLIDSTPPAPQRSFPRSQAEVPRGSQDHGPSRPNDLTPSLKRGRHHLAHLSSSVSLCVAQRLRSGSMAPATEIMRPPKPPRDQLSGGENTELLDSSAQKFSPSHVLLVSECTLVKWPGISALLIPLVSPVLPSDTAFPGAHSWNLRQSILRYAIFCILS